MGRREFHEEVLARSKGRCVVCAGPAVDAHHILDRSLFADGGYHADNGAALCAACHVAAEDSAISPAELRRLCGIGRVLLPEVLDAGDNYDKWGNAVLAPGVVARGPLCDAKLQAHLARSGVTVTEKMKYPRTPHLPYSPGVGSDDIFRDDSMFDGVEVVITEKMDGENTTIYPDGSCHARSVNSSRHASRARVAALAARIGPQLSPGTRLVGENCYAVHSIEYQDLRDHFLLFAVMDGRTMLSWDDTLLYAEVLELSCVPQLYRGAYDCEATADLALAVTRRGGEGLVVRAAGPVRLSQFDRSVAKWVRAGHITTDANWASSPMRTNGLAL